MFRCACAALVVIGAVCLLAGTSVARDRSGGIGTLPGLGTLEGQQNIVIHDSRGGTTVGTYNRDSGSLFLSGPQNQLTIGQQDSAGNIVIQEYGGEDDD